MKNGFTALQTKSSNGSISRLQINAEKSTVSIHRQDPNSAWKEIGVVSLKSDLSYSKKKLVPLSGEDTFNRCYCYKNSMYVFVVFNFYGVELKVSEAVEIFNISDVYVNTNRISGSAVSGTGEPLICYCDEGKIYVHIRSANKTDSVFGNILIPIG